MDYNYVRMRNAVKAGDKKAAEKYRNLFEEGQRPPHKRRWQIVVLIVLLILAAALGTYIALIRGGENAPAVKEKVTAEPIETPVIVTQPETAEGVE